MAKPTDILAAQLYGDSQRVAEMKRLHRAMHAALSATHTDGEQDALALYEAFALMLAQLIAGVRDDLAHGILLYIRERCLTLRPEFAAAGTAARSYVEALQ